MARSNINFVYIILVLKKSDINFSYADSNIESYTIKRGIYEKNQVIEKGYVESGQ